MELTPVIETLLVVFDPTFDDVLFDTLTPLFAATAIPTERATRTVRIASRFVYILEMPIDYISFRLAQDFNPTI